MKIEVYTDGATSNNGYENAIGGWASIIYIDNVEVKKVYGRMPNATNQQMEMVAMIEGCSEALALAYSLGIKDIYVYSDSAYCLNCYVQKWYKNWYLNGWKNAKKQPVANRNLWEKLIHYFENTRFHFIKVKGHSGDPKNEAVDQLAIAAKEGRII